MKLNVQMVKERDSATLHGIIKNHIHQNTTIFSDSWPAYQGIRRLGFAHYQVNHSKHFIEIQDEVASREQVEENVRHEVERIEEMSDGAEDSTDQTHSRVVSGNTQKMELLGGS